MEQKNREIKTVMHQVRIRHLTIKNIQELSPSLRRITFTGDDLAGFTSLSPDDHIKVFFPYPGEEKAVVPVFGPNGPETADGRRPIMRDYTPRRYDETAQELDIEFYLHGEGPGSSWAKNAKLGQTLTIGGPRGSRIVPYNFDSYLMIGDECALPSFARRLNELPEGAKAIIVAEVEDAAHEISFTGPTSAEVIWIHRNGSSAGTSEKIIQQLSKLKTPAGDCFTWIATEKSSAKQIEAFLISVKNANQEWIKTTGYWNKGGSDH